MPRRETNKNPLTSMTIPFWDFLAILQSGIKNINWAAKDVGTWKSRMRALDTREQFLRGKPRTMLG
jgi:hypothetical protein